MRVLLLLVFVLSSQAAIQAAVAVNDAPPANLSAVDPAEPILTLEDIRQLRNREIGQKLGRKLSLRESIVFGIIRGRMKAVERKEARRQRRNARRISRGLPPLAEKVNTSISWLSLGSLGLFLLSIALIFGSTGSGLIIALWLLGIIGMLVFGGMGRKIYRGTNEEAFNRSSFAFYIGIIAGGLTLLGIIILAATFESPL